MDGLRRTVRETKLCQVGDWGGVDVATVGHADTLAVFLIHAIRTEVTVERCAKLWTGEDAEKLTVFHFSGFGYFFSIRRLHSP